MLTDFPVTATLPVSDMGRARHFYESVLGFSAAREEADGVSYRAGDTEVLVYPSAYAGTNKGTAASFRVPEDDFDAEVAALQERGIEFQTFDYEGVTWDDGVATLGSLRSVWFSDPDGNILAVVTSP